MAKPIETPTQTTTPPVAEEPPSTGVKKYHLLSDEVEHVEPEKQEPYVMKTTPTPAPEPAEEPTAKEEDNMRRLSRRQRDNWKTYKVGGPYQIMGQWYYPKEDLDYAEEGVASWYGPKFHNKLTANGENAGLLNFDQKRGLFRQLGGDRDRQGDFETIVIDGGALGAQVDVYLRAIFLAEYFGGPR